MGARFEGPSSARAQNGHNVGVDALNRCWLGFPLPPEIVELVRGAQHDVRRRAGGDAIRWLHQTGALAPKHVPRLVAEAAANLGSGSPSAAPSAAETNGGRSTHPDRLDPAAPRDA